MNGLKEKVIHGISWSLGARIFQQLSSFIIITILARLLTPDDFGLVGMVTVFTGFATIFAQLGLSAALVQNQNIDERHYSSAFFLNIISGGILTSLFILLAPLIAAFYNKPELKQLIVVLSFNFVIASFSIVQKAILTKEMDFKRISLAESIGTTIGGLTGIILAIRGYGVWSLVFQMLTFTFTAMILLWLWSPFRPKLIFSLDAINDIFSFSAHLTGFNLVNYFARNVDYLLIGKFLGAEALGYYTLAYKLMMYPLRNISQVIGQVMYPAFSHIQNDLDKVRNNYLKMVKAISLVTFPMMFGLLAVAPEFVSVVYGPQWNDIVILIRIFCICGLFQSIGTTIGNILLSQGRADLQFKLQLLGTFLVIISVLVGLTWGITGVAFAYTLQSIFWVNFTLVITNKLIYQNVYNFYKIFFFTFLFSTIMIVVVFSAKHFSLLTGLSNLIVLIITGFLTYTLLLFLSKDFLLSNILPKNNMNYG